MGRWDGGKGSWQLVAQEKSVTQSRIFYGWMIVLVGFITQTMVTSMSGYAYGVFVKPMSDDLAWGRAVTSGVSSFSTLVSGFIAPFLGPRIDKQGARNIMLFGTVMTGISVIVLGFVQGVWDFYFVRGVLVTLGVACAGGLSVNVAVSNWFIRRRGRAVSIAAMGVSFGGVIIAPFAAFLIESFGWRTAWIVLGITVLATSVLPVALLIKRRPEDIGLLPDGDPPFVANLNEGMASRAQTIKPTEVAWTRAEAIRTPALWLTIFAFGFGQMGMGAMVMHLYPYLSDIGLTAAAAALGVSVEAGAAFVSKPIWGLLIDRYNVRSCGVAAFTICTVGIAALGVLSIWPMLWAVYLSATLYGIAMGGQIPIQEVLWANYFGRVSLGAIRSTAMPFSIIFSAGGPLFAGYAYDLFHSYQVAFAIFTVTYAIAAILVYMARPPKKKAIGDTVVSAG